MTTLLERDDLLGDIDQALESARGGMGSLLLISGEAGAGKTALVRKAQSTIDQDVIVLWGACDPLSTPRPLSPVMDFAMSPSGGLEGLRDPSLEQSELFTMVLDSLRRRLRPILMVVEDVHWADEASLDFLKFVGRRVADSNAVIACTYRDDELGGDHPLRSVLAQLVPLDSTHRMPVMPLSLEAVTSLTAGHDIDSSQLLTITGGNAFYVTEVLATGQHVPTSVQDAVLVRVHALGEASRAAVEAVSISPRALEMEYVEPLSGASAAQLDHAVNVGVLASEGQSFRFRHELAREAVEVSIPFRRRIVLHLRMVGLLAESDPIDLARIAHHSIQSGSEDLIVEYGPKAARQAAQRSSHREAVAFYDATLAHADSIDPDTLADVRVRAAHEYGILDRPADGLTNAQLAADHYEAVGRIEEQAEALRTKSMTQWSLTETSAARHTAQQIIDLLEPHGPSEALARALYNAGHLQMLARHYRPGMAFAGRSKHIADEIGDEQARRLADHDIGCLEIVAGSPAKGAALLRRLVEEGIAASDDRFVSLTLSNLGSAAGESRMYQEATQALEECIAYASDRDEDAMVAYDRAWLARIAFEQGRWEQVEGYVDLVEIGAQNKVGISVVTGRGALGRTRVRRGDEGGRQLLEESVELGVLHEVQHVWSLWCGIAEHSWLWGKADSIANLLTPIYERALDTDSSWARGEVGFWMWMGGAIDGPPDGAAKPFALHMSGDWSGAADAWRTIGCLYETALALADGDEAAQLESLSIFDSLGARPAASKLRARMRKAGIVAIPRGPIRETMSNPANLTPRQMEVVTLMAKGLNNAEIAEHLFVSKRTVENHVSAVFSKLGVDSREAAIEAVSLLLTKN